MRNIRRKLDKEALEYNYWLFNVMKEDLEIHGGHPNVHSGRDL